MNYFSALNCSVWFCQRSNAAELLRLYLDYDQLAEAAELAVEYIRAALGAGKEYFGLKVQVDTLQ